MEHPPSILTFARDVEPGHASFAHHSIAALAERILTGCVYDAELPETFGLLVTRGDPRTNRRYHRTLAPIHAHWPLYAPSMQLLTGHDTACRVRRCRGVGRHAGHATIHLGWPDFAAAYRAELEVWPFLTRLAVARQLVTWLCTSPTITILSFEDHPREGSTAECWAQRHVFRDWLRCLLPLAIPMGAAQLIA